MTKERKRWDLRLYLTREPVILALLSFLTVVFFLAVTGLSRIYHTQQDSLGERWYKRGVIDFGAKRFALAVTDFRTALLYSRDNFVYRLNLAEALIGMKRTDEAYTYLINLWDLQPQNGLVNLELARIAAGRNETDQAQRYYHNAIYATWPGDRETERREARLELIDFLLQIKLNAQAQSELIALASNLGDEPALQAQVGDLFARAQDYEHALAAYRASLKSNRQNAAALAGAGFAAFELGQYTVAQRYLQAAVVAAPGDAENEARLKITELVLLMDPFRRQISVTQRDRIVIDSFRTAGERLQACGALPAPVASGASQAELAAEWMKMKPKINERGLRRNPDLFSPAMELVFNIERLSNGTCPAPTDKDTALLLIAKLHEGS